ncbi:MAG: hypothetical protein HY825_16835 [Acidobacteria bacterium]|nr:hypothetical protein [Acidobacteriota bacterium]
MVRLLDPEPPDPRLRPGLPPPGATASTRSGDALGCAGRRSNTPPQRPRRIARFRRLPAPAVLAACTFAACGGSATGADEPAAAVPTIVVFPPEWITESTWDDADAGAAAVAGVSAAGVANVDPLSVITALGEPLDSTCLEEPACVRGLGERLGATKVLLVRLAGLGDTVAVRLVLVDVATGAEESSRQDVVQDATAERVAAAVEAAAASLAAPLAPPPPEPWYEDWRLWVGIGAGALAAGGAAAAGILLAPGDPARPDVTVTPP